MNSLKTTFRRALLAGLLPFMAFSSCVREQAGEVTPADQALVTFSLNVPGQSAPGSRSVGSRAMSQTDENAIADVSVLAFKEGIYSYKASTSNVEANGAYNQKKFTVTLRKGAYDLVILANAADILGGASLAGKTKAEAMALLEADAPASGKWAETGSIKRIPMWGHTGVKNVGTDVISEITLLRMVARVNVTLDEAGSKFVMQSVHLYNYNAKGMAAPAQADWSNGSWDYIATAPNLPAAPGRTLGPVAFPATTTTSCINEVYLFEAAAGSKTTLPTNPCIVVGGTYDGQPAFYRVDFATSPDAYLALKRNHSYNISITAVKTSGHPTADDAFNAGPENILVKILEWNDTNIGDVTFNGVNYLSISPGSELVFYKDAYGQTIKVKTDYSAGWSVGKITDENGTELTDTGKWFSTTETGGAAGDYRDLTINVEANAGAARTGYVYITAGRITARVKVNQGTTPQRTPSFRFVEFTNVAGAGTTVPAAGGAIKAKVNTNMGWSLKTDNAAITAYTFAEPSSEVAADCEGSITIPVNESWNAKSVKVWVEYTGTNMAEQTYTQTAGYRIALTAPASVGRDGGSTAFTFSGYWPANTSVQAVAVPGGTVVGGPVPIGAATGGSISANGTLNKDISIAVNATGADRSIKLQYYNGTTWDNVTDGAITQSGAIISAADGGEADLLYYDSATQTLQVGKRYPAGPVTQENQMFFKFGSVVGFLNNNANGTSWASSVGGYSSNVVKFNPSNKTETDLNDYGAIPVYVASDYTNQIFNVSETVGPYKYHTIENVRAGKGDPCKLVGMKAADLKAIGFGIDAGWRLPTAKDNAAFVKGPNLMWQTWTTANGVNAYSYGQGPSTTGNLQANYWQDNSGTAADPGMGWFPATQGATLNTSGKIALPATGYRTIGGEVSSIGTNALYWSSTSYSSSNGYLLNFYSSALCPIISNNYWNGFAVRCVRD